VIPLMLFFCSPHTLSVVTSQCHPALTCPIDLLRYHLCVLQSPVIRDCIISTLEQMSVYASIVQMLLVVHPSISMVDPSSSKPSVVQKCPHNVL